MEGTPGSENHGVWYTACGRGLATVRFTAQEQACLLKAGVIRGVSDQNTMLVGEGQCRASSAFPKVPRERRPGSAGS
jgi:hypothetical protein